MLLFLRGRFRFGRVCLRELAGAFVVPLSCGGWRHLARDSGSGACERGLVCTDLSLRPDDGGAATGDTFFSHLWRRLNEDDADVLLADAAVVRDLRQQSLRHCKSVCNSAPRKGSWRN